MRVAVDDPQLDQRRPPGLEQGPGDAVAGFLVLALEGGQAATVQPVHGQQPAGRQVLRRRGHGDVVAAGEEVAVEPHGLGLALVVQLLADAGGDLDDDLAGVDGAEHLAADGQDRAQLRQVALHRALHVGILQLHGQGPAVERGGPVNLAKGGGGGGGEVEAAEPGLPVGAQFRRHPPAHEGAGHGRGVGLQLGQFGGELRRQQVGDGGEHLRHLHQRALEPAKRLLQRLGVAGADIAAGEEGVGAESGRRAAQPRPHPGEAGHPAAEPITFRVTGHATQTRASNSSTSRSRLLHPDAQNAFCRGSRPKGARAST